MQYLKTSTDKAGVSTQTAVELIGGKGIAKGVTLVIRKAASVALEVHGMCMQALMHAAEHGDVVYLDRLFKGLHDSQRPLSIKRWAMKYGPLYLSKDKDGNEVLRISPKVRKDGTPNAAYRPFDIQAAADNPYWTFKADKGAEEFTLAQLLAFVAKKIKAGETAIEQDQFTGSVVSFLAAKADLEGVIDKYSGAAEPSKALGQSIAKPEPVEEDEPADEAPAAAVL